MLLIVVLKKLFIFLKYKFFQNSENYFLPVYFSEIIHKRFFMNECT